MSEHNHDCDCGCNEDALTVTLTLDDNEEVECAVLTIYEVKGQQYIALLPIEDEEDDEEEGDVFIYRFQESETGEPVLDNIEDDDEYDLAAEAFDEWLDEQEFEEMDGDEE